MEKIVKFGEVVSLGAYLLNNEDVFEGMKLKAKAMYSVLKLKKTIVERFSVAQETIMELAKTHGATPANDQQRSLQVPPENVDAFNEDYAELMKEDVSLVYDPIEISEDMECNNKFMETFFDFILITN